VLLLLLSLLLFSFAKVYLRCKDGEGISAIPPKPYADRFVRFMSDITRSDEEEAACIAAAGNLSVSMGDARHNPAAMAVRRSLGEEIIESDDEDEERKDGADADADAADVRLDVKQHSERLFSGTDSSDSAFVGVDEHAPRSSASAAVQPVSTAALSSTASPSVASTEADSGMAAMPSSSSMPAGISGNGTVIDAAIQPASEPNGGRRSIALQPMSVTASAHGSGSALASTSEWSNI
jgi:hypothetical protein